MAKSINFSNLQNEPQHVLEALAFYTAFMLHQLITRRQKDKPSTPRWSKQGTLRKWVLVMGYTYNPDYFTEGDRVKIIVHSEPELIYSGKVSDIKEDGFWWYDSQNDNERQFANDWFYRNCVGREFMR